MAEKRPWPGTRGHRVFDPTVAGEGWVIRFEIERGEGIQLGPYKVSSKLKYQEFEMIDFLRLLINSFFSLQQ